MVPHETRGSRRAGAACVAAAGLLIPLATLLRGPFVDPSADAAAFAAWVTSRVYVTAGLLFIAGILFQIFGLLGLYPLIVRGRSPRAALAGTILTLLTDGLMLLAMGVFCFALPAVGRAYLDGHHDALSIAMSFGASFVGFQALQALTLTVGTILSAVAIGRTPALPRWCGVAYGVSGIVIAFCPPLPFVTELPATAVFGITYLVLARTLWRTGETRWLSTQPA